MKSKCCYICIEMFFVDSDIRRGIRLRLVFLLRVPFPMMVVLRVVLLPVVLSLVLLALVPLLILPFLLLLLLRIPFRSRLLKWKSMPKVCNRDFMV